MSTSLTCRVSSGKILSLWTCFRVSISDLSLTFAKVSHNSWLTRATKSPRQSGSRSAFTIYQLCRRLERWRLWAWEKFSLFKVLWLAPQRWSLSYKLAHSSVNSACKWHLESSKSTNTLSQSDVIMTAASARSSTWITQRVCTWTGRKSVYKSSLLISQLALCLALSMWSFVAILSIKQSLVIVLSSQEHSLSYQTSSS